MHTKNLMLCNIWHILTGAKMSIGPSGRIVVEVEPELKRELHSALLKDGTTLKEWFLVQAQRYLRNGTQLDIFDATSALGPLQKNSEQ